MWASTLSIVLELSHGLEAIARCLRQTANHERVDVRRQISHVHARCARKLAEVGRDRRPTPDRSTADDRSPSRQHPTNGVGSDRPLVPRHCSGDIYAGVPSIVPVSVASSSPSSASWQIPKSRSFVRSPACASASWTRKMFAGFKSRWITPLACATASEAVTWRAMRNASTSCNRFSRRSAPTTTHRRGTPSRGRRCHRRDGQSRESERPPDRRCARLPAPH